MSENMRKLFLFNLLLVYALFAFAQQRDTGKAKGRTKKFITTKIVTETDEQKNIQLMLYSRCEDYGVVRHSELQATDIAANADDEYDFSVNGINYKIKNANTVEVTRSSLYSGAISIPRTVVYKKTTYTITSIGNEAFSACYYLTSVTIPSSVRSIGNEAFRDCSRLTSITIPNSVTSLGDGVFYNCRYLTSVTISDSVTNIGNEAFYYCYGLKSITIPNSVTSIGESAFTHCLGLKNVTIPNSVTSIGNEAFSGCRYLKSVTIQSSVTSLGDYAFSGCSGLTSVTIPSSVRNLGESAFSWCSGLTNAILNVKCISERTFECCEKLTSLTLSGNLTSIDNYAFHNCKNLNIIKCYALSPPRLFYQGRRPPSNVTLYVPKSSVYFYKKNESWKEICSEVLPMPDETDGYSNLVLWQKNSEKVVFVLLNKPKITFSRTDLIVSTDGLEFSYPLNDLSHFTFENLLETPVADIKTDDVVFRMEGESLLFPSLDESTLISIYKTNGVLVFQKKIKTAGQYIFPLLDLKSGVYIVKVNNLSYKIIKK